MNAPAPASGGSGYFCRFAKFERVALAARAL
jgi:hypothetical protein